MPTLLDYLTAIGISIQVSTAHTPHTSTHRASVLSRAAQCKFVWLVRFCRRMPSQPSKFCLNLIEVSALEMTTQLRATCTRTSRSSPDFDDLFGS